MRDEDHQSAHRADVLILANTRLATAVILVLLATLLVADAQQPEKTYRVAYLAAAPRFANQAVLGWFEQGMRDLGYVQGRNLVISSDSPTESSNAFLCSPRSW